MSKIALYRKYRPLNFSQVYGQELIIKTLQNAIKEESINHAYIFSGPRGSGKTSIAKIFSRAINCLNLNDDCDTCFTCEACKNSFDENSLDIIELDAASNNGVNEIRNIINSVSFIPNNLKYKVYIIDEAHMLTTGAWNALLKTLEEPPKHVVFIFATTEYHKIPATIISRCQRFDFTRLNDNSLKKLLENIASNENIKIDNQAINTIISLSDGAARDAISILDQLTSFSNHICENDVNDVFGLVNIENKISLLNYIFDKDIENIVLFLNQEYEKGANLYILTTDLIKILFDKIIYMQTNNYIFLKILNESNINLLKNIELNKLINIVNHLSSNVYKIAQSSDRLFETQLLLLQLITILDTNNHVINSIKIEKNDSFEPKKNLIDNKINDESEQKMFETNIRLINKSMDNENIKSEPNNFVPPKPKSINTTKDDIKIDTNNEQVVSIEKSAEIKNVKKNVDYKTFFLKVANNNNNELKTSMNNIYLKLQENRLLETPNINKLLLAKKILVCSQNGAVLLFENAKQSDNFNEIADTIEIQTWLSHNFNRNFRIIGIDKNNAKIWTDEYKNMDVTSLVDVEPINDNKKDTKSLILDILNE